MKKLISLMLVLALCLSVAAVAEAVPSKSTADLTKAEVTLSVENKPSSSNAFITPVVVPELLETDEDMPEEEKEELQKKQEQYQAHIEICNQEISKLVSLVQTVKAASLEEKIAQKSDAAEGEAVEPEEVELDEVEVAAAQTAAIESFFTDVKNPEGEQVTLKQVLGVAEEEEVHLDVSEFFPVVAGGFEETDGKVVANMSLATTFEKDEKVAVLVGIVKVLDDGTTQIVWTALEAFGQDNGGISVELPPELVLAIQEGTAIMSVVRNVSGK